DVSESSSNPDSDSNYFSDASLRFLEAARLDDFQALKDLLNLALQTIQPHHLFKYGRHSGSRSHPISVAEAALPEPFVLHAAALLAIQHHNTDALKLLLDTSVPPNNINASLDPNDWAPLDHPIRTFFPQRLVEQRSPATLLSWASADPEATPCARLLLLHGANPNAKDGKGRAPLVFAAWNEATATLRLLHDHRATLDDRNGENAWTALHYACKGGRTDVVRMLVELGAAVDVLDKEKRCPRDIALAEGRTDVAKILSWAADAVVGPLLRLPAKEDPDVNDFRDRVLAHRDSQLSNKEPPRPSEDDEAAVEQAVAEGSADGPTTNNEHESLSDSTSAPTPPTSSTSAAAAPLEKALMIRMSTTEKLVRWLDLARAHVSSRRDIGLELESVVASVGATCSILEDEKETLARRVAHLEDQRGACQAAVARAETDVRSNLATELGEGVGNPIKEANEKILAGITAKIAEHRARSTRCGEKQGLLRRVADVAEAVMEELEADISRCERAMAETSSRTVERASSLYRFLTQVAVKAERAKENLVASMASCEQRAVLARDGGLDRWADDLEEERRRCAHYLNDSVTWLDTLRGYMAKLKAVHVPYMELGADGKVYYGDMVPVVWEGGPADGRGRSRSHSRQRSRSAHGDRAVRATPPVVYRYQNNDGSWSHFFVDEQEREVHFDPQTGEQWMYEDQAAGRDADEFGDLGAPVEIPEAEREERRKRAERVRAANRAVAARAVGMVSKFDPPGAASRDSRVPNGDLLANTKVVTIKRPSQGPKEPKHKMKPQQSAPVKHGATSSAIKESDRKEKQIEKEIIRRFLHQEAAAAVTSSATDTSSDDSTLSNSDEPVNRLRHTRSRSRSRSPGRSKPPHRSESQPPATKRTSHSPAGSNSRSGEKGDQNFGSHSHSQPPDGFHVHIHSGDQNRVGTRDELSDMMRKRAWEMGTSADSDLDTIFLGSPGGQVREYITPRRAMKVLGSPGGGKHGKGDDATAKGAQHSQTSVSPTVGGPVYKNYITVSGGPSRLAKSRAAGVGKTKDVKGKAKTTETADDYEQTVSSPWGYPISPGAYPGLYIAGYGSPMQPAPPPMMYPPYGMSPAQPPHYGAMHMPTPYGYPVSPPQPQFQRPRGRATPSPAQATTRSSSRFTSPQARVTSVDYSQYSVPDDQDVPMEEGYDLYYGEPDTYGERSPTTPIRGVVRPPSRTQMTSPSRPVSPQHTRTSAYTLASPPPTPTKPPSLRATPTRNATSVPVRGVIQQVPQRAAVSPHKSPPPAYNPRLGDFERAEAQATNLYAKYMMDNGVNPRTSQTPPVSKGSGSAGSATAPSAASSGRSIANTVMAPSGSHPTLGSLPARAANSSKTSPPVHVPGPSRGTRGDSGQTDWVAVAEAENAMLYEHYLRSHGN
ncbi:hypothetical protein HDU93_001774, partial [Gonapodya sp. JEL0774]